MIQAKKISNRLFCGNLPNTQLLFKAIARLSYLLLLVPLASNIYASESGSVAEGNDAEVNTFIEPNSIELNSASGTENLIQSAHTKEGRRPDNLYRASQAVFVGSIVADLGSTWRLPKDMTEGNPVLGKNKGQQAAVSSGLCFFTMWEAHTLKTHGHARAAKYILLAGTAVHTFAALHNTLQFAR